MSLSTTTSKIMYTGNGVTTQWDIPFPFLDKNDLQIYRIGIDGISTLLTSDYQINETTRVLTYPLQTNGVEPLAVGEKLLILRHTPRTQSIQLTAQETVDASLLENAYDKVMMVCQELDEKLSSGAQLSQGTSLPSADMQSYITRLEELFSQATQSLEQAQEIEQNLRDAQASIELAQAWATKMDGPVSGTEYSAKKYAQDASSVLSSMSDMADTSLSNLTSQGQSKAASFSMPSVTKTTLTFGASNTIYTAPANGWLYCLYQLSVGGWLQLSCNGISSRATNTGSSSGYFSCMLPVKTTDVVALQYSNVDSTAIYNILQFIYAEGSSSEAN